MRFHPKRWSLATKWSLVLTALALGPLLAVIRYSYGNASAQLLQQSVASLGNSSADAATSLDEAVGERVRQVRFLATLPSVRAVFAAGPFERTAALADVQADFLALQASYPFLESLELVDSQGVTLYSTTGVRGVATDSATLLKTVTAGQVYVTELRQQVGKADPALVIAAPVTAGGKPGILRTQTSSDFLRQRLARDGQRQGGGALSFLVDSQGKVIASSDAAAAPEMLALEPGGKLVLSGSQSFFARSSKLGLVPWTYVMAVPEASLLAPLNQQRNEALLLAIGVCFIIGALARLLALGFTKPLVRMVAITRALAAADLTYDIKPTQQQDEVGQLQNAFADAYGQLRKLVARMRLSSILVAEAAGHIHTMTAQVPSVSGSLGTASEKLSVVAKDLERQVIHFKV